MSLQLIHQAQLGSRGVNHGPFEDVFQFPDIAGPVIILQGIHEACRNDLNGLAHSLGDLFDVKVHKKWNVIQPNPRSGGMVIGKIFKRYQRSSRNRPLRTSSSRLRFVAAIIRTSTLIVWELPNLSNSPSWTTLSSLGCNSSGNSPISSRKGWRRRRPQIAPSVWNGRL